MKRFGSRPFGNLNLMTASVCFTSAIVRYACACGVILVAFAATAGSADDRTPAAPTVKTVFADEHARLSGAEVDQVVSLAKDCGLRDVAVIQTFYVLPSRVRGICVTSDKKTMDRNTTYECVYASRIGWQANDPPTKAKRAGPFWVTKPYKSPVLLRAYHIEDKRIEIQICDRIRPALADAVLAQILGHKVQFKNEECRSAFSKLDFSQTESISKEDDGSYNIEFASNTILRFEYSMGKVVITDVEDYII